MRTFFLIISMMTMVNLACDAVPEQQRHEIEVEPEHFELESVVLYRNQELEVHNSPFWTPSDSQVAALEQALPIYLNRAWPQGPLPDLSTYRFQYIGMVRDAEPIIYINAFCQASGDEWKDLLVVVDDGGPCYFQLYYHPDGSRFSGLTINAEA